MTKRVINRYKILKFYQEDLWGQLAIRKSFKKVKINRLFHEIFQEKNAFRNELQTERVKLQESLGMNDTSISNKERKRREQIFKKLFRDLSKGLRHIYFRIPFNFRIDKGKPKRKIRRLTRFARRLKQRHQLRKFATQSMTVRQLRSYVRRARRSRMTFIQFFRLLETRVDTLAVRLNLVFSGGEARQLLNHKNFLINGSIVNFPTESIDIYDVFSVKDKEFFYKKSLGLFAEKRVIHSVPSYLEVNFRIMVATIFIWPTAGRMFYFRKMDPRLLIANGPRIRN